MTAATLLACLGRSDRLVRADTVTLETGVTYEGTVDKDGTILSIYSDLKRVVVRDTKVEKVEETALQHDEEFRVDQPLTVHGGKMPVYAINLQYGPWDEKGRRSFRYIGPGSSKPVQFTQAINALGPRDTQVRGVDGFWRNPLATSRVPKSVVLAILAKVDQTNQGERLKVGRFLIQAEWYPEALAELARLEHDFPELKETVATVRASVLGLQSRARLEEIDQRLRAQQPKAARSLLETFPPEGVAADVLRIVRDDLVKADARGEADRG